MGTPPLPEQIESPTVSVIIPAYQAARTIGRALESVAAQTVLPSQIIVIDDGSDDGTIDAANKKIEPLHGIDLRVLHQNHKGAGAARNLGLREATSTYVAFLDADDEWLSEKLARSLEEITRTNSVLVSHNYILRDITGHDTTVLKCDRNFQAPGDPFVNLYKKGYIATSAVLARRDALIAAGGFDESLHTAQDFALWLALLKPPGTPFHIFSDALIRYHVTSGSITSHTKRRLECSLKIARDFRPNLASFLYRVLAIHYEAVTVYRAQGKVAKAVAVIALLPFNLAGGKRSTAAALWLWVGGASAAYLYQFRGFIDPIAQILGVK